MDTHKVFQPLPVKSQYKDFELSLGKVFSADSVTGGESELLKNIQSAAEHTTKKQSLDEICAEFTYWQSFSDKEVPQTLVKKKSKEPGIGIINRLFLNDGLEYRLNNNWSFGVKVDNPLGWLQSEEDEDGNSIFSSSSHDAEASLLFTLKYSF